MEELRNEVVATGDLYMQMNVKSWLLKKFIMSGITLSYLDGLGNKRGKFDCTNCTVKILSPEDVKFPNAKFPFGLVGHKGLTWLLCAVSGQDRDVWIDIINIQIDEFKDDNRRFLNSHEIIRGWGCVKRGGIFGMSTYRMLLTNYPRIIFIDMNSWTVKQEIRWTLENVPSYRKVDDKHFSIVYDRNKEVKLKVPKKEKLAGRGLDYWGKLLAVALRRTKLFDLDTVNEPIVIGIAGQLVEDLDRVNWEEIKRRKPVTPTQKDFLSTPRQRMASVLYDTPELFDLLDNGDDREENRVRVNDADMRNNVGVKHDGSHGRLADSGYSKVTNSNKKTPGQMSTQQRQQNQPTLKLGRKQKLENAEENMRKNAANLLQIFKISMNEIREAMEDVMKQILSFDVASEDKRDAATNLRLTIQTLVYNLDGLVSRGMSQGFDEALVEMIHDATRDTSSLLRALVTKKSDQFFVSLPVHISRTSVTSDLTADVSQHSDDRRKMQSVRVDSKRLTITEMALNQNSASMKSHSPLMSVSQRQSFSRATFFRDSQFQRPSFGGIINPSQTASGKNATNSSEISEVKTPFSDHKANAREDFQWNEVNYDTDSEVIAAANGDTVADAVIDADTGGYLDVDGSPENISKSSDLDDELYPYIKSTTNINGLRNTNRPISLLRSNSRSLSEYFKSSRLVSEKIDPLPPSSSPVISSPFAASFKLPFSPTSSPVGAPPSSRRPQSQASSMVPHSKTFIDLFNNNLNAQSPPAVSIPQSPSLSSPSTPPPSPPLINLSTTASAENAPTFISKASRPNSMTLDHTLTPPAQSPLTVKHSKSPSTPRVRQAQTSQQLKCSPLSSAFVISTSQSQSPMSIPPPSSELDTEKSSPSAYSSVDLPLISIPSSSAPKSTVFVKPSTPPAVSSDVVGISDNFRPQGPPLMADVLPRNIDSSPSKVESTSSSNTTNQRSPPHSQPPDLHLIRSAHSAHRYHDNQVQQSQSPLNDRQHSTKQSQQLSKPQLAPPSPKSTPKSARNSQASPHSPLPTDIRPYSSKQYNQAIDQIFMASPGQSPSSSPYTSKRFAQLSTRVNSSPSQRFSKPSVIPTSHPNPPISSDNLPYFATSSKWNNSVSSNQNSLGTGLPSTQRDSQAVQLQAGRPFSMNQQINSTPSSPNIPPPPPSRKNNSTSQATTNNKLQYQNCSSIVPPIPPRNSSQVVPPLNRNVSAITSLAPQDFRHPNDATVLPYSTKASNSSAALKKPPEPVSQQIESRQEPQQHIQKQRLSKSTFKIDSIHDLSTENSNGSISNGVVRLNVEPDEIAATLVLSPVSPPKYKPPPPHSRSPFVPSQSESFLTEQKPPPQHPVNQQPVEQQIPSQQPPQQHASQQPQSQQPPPKRPPPQQPSLPQQATNQQPNPQQFPPQLPSPQKPVNQQTPFQQSPYQQATFQQLITQQPPPQQSPYIQPPLQNAPHLQQAHQQLPLQQPGSQQPSPQQSPYQQPLSHQPSHERQIHHQPSQRQPPTQASSNGADRSNYLSYLKLSLASDSNSSLPLPSTPSSSSPTRNASRSPTQHLQQRQQEIPQMQQINTTYFADYSPDPRTRNPHYAPPRPNGPPPTPLISSSQQYKNSRGQFPSTPLQFTPPPNRPAPRPDGTYSPSSGPSRSTSSTAPSYPPPRPMQTPPLTYSPQPQKSSALSQFNKVGPLSGPPLKPPPVPPVVPPPYRPPRLDA